MAIHPQSVAEGDPITCVHPAREGTLCGQVRGHTAEANIIVDFAGFAYHVPYSAEGVFWIRGHARTGTWAAAALIAAFKLSRMLE